MDHPQRTIGTGIILSRAADLIEEYGHAKGAYEDKSGRLCAAGAIRQAARESLPPRRYIDDEYDLVREETEAAAFALTEVIGQPGASIPYWNDHPSRTQEEVVAALRAAARGHVESRRI